MKSGALFGLLLVLLPAPSPAGSETLSTNNFDVLDGHTLVISGREIRLTGIVAPELGQRCMLFGKAQDCGLIARAGLLDLTAGATVTCAPEGDVDGRPAHRCTAGGYDLSEGMVYTGWALPLDGAPKVYWRVLKGARSRPRGFWRGSFVEPWAPHVKISGNP